MLLTTFVCLRKKVLWFWCLNIYKYIYIYLTSWLSYFISLWFTRWFGKWFPQNHCTLLQRGLTLYSRVLGSPNHLFWDTMILRVNIFDHISRVVKLWEWRVRFWSWFFLGQRFRQLTVGIHYIYIYLYTWYLREVIGTRNHQISKELPFPNHHF